MDCGASNQLFTGTLAGGFCLPGQYQQMAVFNNACLYILKTSTIKGLQLLRTAMIRPVSNLKTALGLFYCVNYS